MYTQSIASPRDLARLADTGLANKSSQVADPGLPRTHAIALRQDHLQGESMRARIILVFVLLAVVSLSAQTFRGTILGTATDPSGAVLPGASVTVKNVGTGLARTTETSADGSYSLPELPIGTYTVTVTLAGFQTFVTTGVNVDVSTERRVDAARESGELRWRGHRGDERQRHSGEGSRGLLPGIDVAASLPRLDAAQPGPGRGRPSCPA